MACGSARARRAAGDAGGRCGRAAIVLRALPKRRRITPARLRACTHRVYRVFRETARPDAEGSPDACAIEVCFRLRWARASRTAHWLFQRACILTTPFWSGFDGFATKLWMVEPASGAYAGIYEWDGPEDARAYLDVLLPVLRAVSVRGSVGFELHAGMRLEELLGGRATTRA
jgi:hypothetical protein